MSDFFSAASDVLGFAGALLALALEVRRSRQSRNSGQTENGSQDDAPGHSDLGGQDG
ncbi:MULTISPECIES: hypothetical protein [Streptomyces griseus group]|uniref:hypothetical protein n=1 Tax=Streptomyces griseus group TaxID=629295 RepID=UPI002F90CF30